jgi:dehydrogenase/reductase SDR family protein 4
MAIQGSVLNKFNLQGKVSLITGGSRGIGRAIALGLAEAGSDVIIISRKMTDLEVVAHEVAEKGRRALPISANMRRLPEIDNLVKQALNEFEHIDILVNNAGTNPVFGSVFNVDEKAWDTTLGLNLKGHFFLSQAVGKIMRDKGGGNIINITSIDGLSPRVGAGVYSMSKAGIIMLTQVLAQEWGQYKIRVNAIAPGVVKTRFSEVLWDNPVIREVTEDSTALGRIAEPEEIVGTALFLASEASSYMTGQTVILDGGHFSAVRTLIKNIK